MLRLHHSPDHLGGDGGHIFDHDVLALGNVVE